MVNSSVMSRAPAATHTPSRAKAFVTASPIPLLAPVTTAALPLRPKSISTVLSQKVELLRVHPDAADVARDGELNRRGAGARSHEALLCRADHPVRSRHLRPGRDGVPAHRP